MVKNICNILFKFQVDVDNDNNIKTEKLMSDWLTSCKDLQVEIGQDVSGELKGRI